MNDQGDLLILGGGGHGAVVAESAALAGWRVIGHLDDDPDRAGAALARHLGPISALPDVLASAPPGTRVHAAHGDAALRRQWLAGSAPAGTVVHPSAIVSRSAVLDDGVMIGPGAIVNARATIGRGAIVNSGAIVEHDCTIGEFAHLAPRAVVAGGVSIGADVLLGVGATVVPGVSIGAGAHLGAGAVAVSDIPAGCRAVGVPARATT